MQIWLGHAVNLLMLMRPALSILDKCYQFVQEALERRIPLWSSVRREMKAIASVVWFAEVDLAAPYHSKTMAPRRWRLLPHIRAARQWWGGIRVTTRQ